MIFATIVIAMLISSASVEGRMCNSYDELKHSESPVKEVDCGDLPCFDIQYIFKNPDPHAFWVQGCLQPHREKDIERFGLKIEDLLKVKNDVRCATKTLKDMLMAGLPNPFKSIKIKENYSVQACARVCKNCNVPGNAPGNA